MRKLVNLFEQVQKIPYRLCKYFPNEINERLEFGSCLHKSDLLLKLLHKENIECRFGIVSFDLADLPIPQYILKILKKSGTVRNHRFVEVCHNNNWIKIDTTWPISLAKIDFPVTYAWNGIEDTIQVSRGILNFYSPNQIIKRYPYKPEERDVFYEAFNQWIGNITPL